MISLIKDSINEKGLISESELKKKFGIKKDEFILLSLGRVAKEKSVDFSIDAFNQFLIDYPDIKTRMVIVGGGPDLENLQEYVKEKGIADKVIFTGACPPSEVQYDYKGHKSNKDFVIELSRTLIENHIPLKILCA